MLLLEQFENLTLHPKNTARLKELVLQLAVQGKLTENWRRQNPDVEPAAELLKRIEAEKAQLVKERKIKKENPLEPISADKVPYTLPEGWSWCRIGQLATIKGGKRVPKGYILQDTPTNHVYIRVTDMKNGTVDLSNLKYISEEVHAIIKQYTISKNDLYITIAGTIGQVGEIPESLDGMNLTENAAKFIFSHLYKDYFKAALTSKEVKAQFIGKVNQLAQPKLALHRIQTTIIPLPPLAEQEAIVARVEELMQKIEELEKQTAERIQLKQKLGTAALQQLTAAADEELEQNWLFLKQHFQMMFDEVANVKKLRETILQLAVQGKLTATWRKQNPIAEPASELLKRIQAEKAQLVKEKKIKKEKPLEPISDDEVPYTLPEGWVWCRLGEICDNITSGSTPDKKHFYETPGTPYLKVYNIRNQKIDFEYKPQFINEAIHAKQLKRSILYPGDVVMNIVGPPLGKIAIIPDSYPEWNCNQAIVFFRPIQLNLNTYIYTFLLAGTFLKEIELIGTAGQDNISVTKSKNILLPLPPLDEQEAIVAKVDQLMQLCDELEQQIHQSKQEVEALMHAVVQDALQVQEEEVA